MRRLAPVATAIAFATLLATPALARPHDIPRTSEYDRSYDRDDDDRESARERRQRRSAQRSQRRTATTRSGRRSAARSESRSVPVARRGVTSFASGGGSRSCLTRATQALLGRIESNFGRVQIISTCRRGAVIATTGRPSKHASGQAVDFNAPSGRKAAVVRWLIANHKSGGIMTYGGMSHIHVDIGYRFVSLNSRGG